jgi:hypothetical protein
MSLYTYALGRGQTGTVRDNHSRLWRECHTAGTVLTNHCSYFVEEPQYPLEVGIIVPVYRRGKDVSSVKGEGRLAQITLGRQSWDLASQSLKSSVTQPGHDSLLGGWPALQSLCPGQAGADELSPSLASLLWQSRLL